ncbi:MAG: hypothetical protein KGV44_01565 [Flavobacteriaceae bacterium]|nr:hypothetical protein [Flavobacteriaceae bacterium]
MKKSKYLLVLIVFVLVYCSNINIISKIDDYVCEIDNRKDLIKTEMDRTIDFSDANGKLYKIIIQVESDSIQKYDFYYKEEKLIFAKVLKAIRKEKSEIDTIVKSEMYFDKGILIKQIGEKSGSFDAKEIYLLADVFTVRGLGTEQKNQ